MIFEKVGEREETKRRKKGEKAGEGKDEEEKSA